MIVLLNAPAGQRSNLGNQLFQLAFGLYLEYELRVKVRYFIRKPSSVKPWSLSVERAEQLVESLIPPDAFTATRGLTDSVMRFGTLIPGLTIGDEALSLHATCPPTYVRHRLLVNGYFQNYFYPEIMRIELLNRFERSVHFNTTSTTSTEQIAVHVRLGDYLANTKNRHIYGSMGLNFYHDSIKFLVNKTGIRSVCVVSDDPSRAYAMIATAVRAIPKLEVSKSDGSVLEDFRTLASSRAVVISNSTFAWWAAWLGNARFETHVVLPRPWYADPQLDGSGLMNPKWTAIFRGESDSA